ncbi:MAG: UDP-N-acetylmuramate--L-alanine ligase [Bacteroidetes bacterium]|nr:UDP-N-acetylmuramate--L-alanine ligase [Bacteroidota bacterium]MDA1121088.1 UDP-N-acetylmuramate--L-alanine ligase [Bacteroidota bacterium]
MTLSNLHNVYFLGIGGIGMSALARWFKNMGHTVTGYDKTQTPLTKQLVKEGIEIHFEDDPSLIHPEVIRSPETSLIIYTPAIPKDHKEFNYLIAKGQKVFKRSEVLGIITANHFTVAVAGTHGKTSTSSMIAHILKSSGRNCAAFVGGIMVNYNSNLILPTREEDCIVVAEADEFDRSFLRLSPNIAVVTAADPDHLDIYGDSRNLKQSFRDFIEKIEESGKLFIKERVADELDLSGLNIDIETYAISGTKIKADNIRIENGFFVFEYSRSQQNIGPLKLHFPGRHNIENALAAISVSLHLGVSENHIKAAIESYRGVRRRFEKIFENDKTVYYDDYAHHPEEIRAFLSALKELLPGRKITAIFQPHLYTRTRDFADGFAESLQLADQVILIPIYPARELPIEGINSEMLLQKINDTDKEIIKKEDVLDKLSKMRIDVLATIGAGDIDQLVAPIKVMLEKRYESVQN